MVVCSREADCAAGSARRRGDLWPIARRLAPGGPPPPAQTTRIGFNGTGVGPCGARAPGKHGVGGLKHNRDAGQWQVTLASCSWSALAVAEIARVELIETLLLDYWMLAKQLKVRYLVIMRPRLRHFDTEFFALLR